MADRVTGKVADLSADIRGKTDETILITITNPYGTDTETNQSTTGNGHGRYSYTTSNTLDIPGVWTATYLEGGSPVFVQEFSVGPRLGYARSLHDLRIDVVSRVEDVHEGYVLDADEKTISDPGLIGGAGDYQGWWIVPDPESPDAGRALMVDSYNGSSLEVAQRFWTALTENDRYTLMDANPREVDRAIRTAVQDLLYLSRIPYTLSDIAVPSDGLITLPDYLTHVVDVWVPDSDVGSVPLANDSWSLQPGRTLYVDTDESTVTVMVLSHAHVPLWEDSLVDIDPAVVIARAAHLLHANRAGSSTIDLDEHLRRQLAARDEYEQSRRSSVGRIPAGSRKILG